MFLSLLFVFNYFCSHDAVDETVITTIVGTWVVDDLDTTVGLGIIGCAVCFVRRSLIEHDTGDMSGCCYCLYPICF